MSRAIRTRVERLEAAERKHRDAGAPTRALENLTEGGRLFVAAVINATSEDKGRFYRLLKARCDRGDGRFTEAEIAELGALVVRNVPTHLSSALGGR